MHQWPGILTSYWSGSHRQPVHAALTEGKGREEGGTGDRGEMTKTHFWRDQREGFRLFLWAAKTHTHSSTILKKEPHTVKRDNRQTFPKGWAISTCNIIEWFYMYNKCWYAFFYLYSFINGMCTSNMVEEWQYKGFTVKAKPGSIEMPCKKTVKVWSHIS